MIKAIRLIWHPEAGWDPIIRQRRSVLSVWFLYLLPLVLICALGEGAVLCKWRTWTDGTHGILHFSLEQITVFETMHAIVTLVIITVCAHIVWLLREPFYGRYDYAQALTVVTCSFCPLLLCRFLEGIHRFSLWAPWAIGIYFTLKIFYSGIRIIAKTDPHSALGLYLISAATMVGLAGAQRYILIMCLTHGASVNSVIFNVAAKL